MTSQIISTKIPLVDLKAQYSLYKDEIDQAIARVLVSCKFIQGEEVLLFEREFANFCSLNKNAIPQKKLYCCSCANGTDALEIAFKTLGISKNDEIIAPSHTFFATVEPLFDLGAKPIFVDIDPQTMVMDTNQIERHITKKTKAIIAVHLYGQPCDMDKINAIAKQYNLFVIEDAAQAHGAFWKTNRVGSMGDIACFSFFPGKNLGAYGDGGAIVSKHEDLVKKAKLLASHGRSKKYEHQIVGRNSRLDALQAAILRVKLKYLNSWNDKRKRLANLYKKYLCDLLIILPTCAEEADSVWHLFVIRCEQRDKLSAFLQSKGILTGVHYPIPVHRQPALKEYYSSFCLPITEKISSEILSLPIFPELLESDVQVVSTEIQSFFS